MWQPRSRVRNRVINRVVELTVHGRMERTERADKGQGQSLPGSLHKAS